MMFGDHGRMYPRSARCRTSRRATSSPSTSATATRRRRPDVGRGGRRRAARPAGRRSDVRRLGQRRHDRRHNVAGAADELATTEPGRLDGAAGPVNDLMDGGSGNDALAGDNAIDLARGDDRSPRFQALSGDGDLQRHQQDRSRPTSPAAAERSGHVVGRDITLLDHSKDAGGAVGDDVMAGGADNDLMFGELGDDLMQGDGLRGGGRPVSSAARWSSPTPASRCRTRARHCTSTSPKPRPTVTTTSRATAATT